MNLIKALLVFIVIVLLMRATSFIARFYKAYKAASENRNAQHQKREGEVIITQKTKKEKKLDKSVGDYVNYEEVD